MGREIIPQEPMPGRPVSADWGRAVVRSLRALWPIQGVGGSITRTPNGTMVESASQDLWVRGGDSAPRPFEVRWHNHGEGKGAWEVYLPWGCATVDNRPCVPQNEDAVDADNKQEIGWYVIDIAPDDSLDTVDAGTKIYRSYPIYALMKPWPAITVSAKKEVYDDEPWFRRKVIALAQEVEWSTAGTDQVSRRAIQYYGSQWTEATGDAKALFAIRYDFDDSGDAKPSYRDAKWKAMLTNIKVTLGRFQASLDEDQDVTEMENVVIKIDHSTDGEYGVSIQDNEEPSSDDATVVTLYRLNKGVVVSDLRTNITTMPFFDV